MRVPIAGCVRGVTLIEILSVLLILGILVAMAAPAMSRFIASWQVTRAINVLHGDLWYARMLAVRSAERVEVRFAPSAANACIERYEVIVLAATERLAKRVDVVTETPGVCLSHNSPNMLRFSSRGLPFGVVARTFTGAKAGITRTMVLSPLGRLYRRD